MEMIFLSILLSSTFTVVSSENKLMDGNVLDKPISTLLAKSECCFALLFCVDRNLVKVNQLESKLPFGLAARHILEVNASYVEKPTVLASRRHVLLMRNREKIVHSMFVCKNNTHMLDTFNLERTQWILSASTETLDMLKMCHNGLHALHGRTIVANIYSPFLHISEDGSEISGIMVDVFNTIVRHYKGHPKVTVSEFAFNADKSFAFNADKSIGGSAGKVIYGQTDVSLDHSMTLGSMFGSISQHVYFQKYGFMEFKPSRKPNFTNIVYPLDYWTWAMLLVSLLATSLTLWYFNARTNILKSLQLAYGILFQDHFIPASLQLSPTKFIILRFIWLSCTLFLSMAFMANLKSSLTKKNFEKRTMTMDEMIDKDIKVHSNIQFTGYLASRERQRTIEDRILCQINKLNTSYFPEYGEMAGPMTFMFRKFDPTSGYFDEVIGIMLQSGVVDRFFRAWMAHEGMKEDIIEPEEKLTAEHFFIPCIIAMGGLIISFISLTVEKITSKKP